MRTDNYFMDNDNVSYQQREQELEQSGAFSILIRKVYIWMTMALAITGVTAYGVATSEALQTLIFTFSAIKWVLIIATFVLVMAISGAIHRMSLTTATLLFTLYSVLMGTMLSSIFLVYSPMLITKVFLITSATFVTMASIGYFTKTDLSSIGKILFMSLLGIIIASVVNIFMRSGSLDVILSYVGVLIFIGLTAYDSQKIKRMLVNSPAADENMQKIALLGSLSLYLDFINMFLYLLHILGQGDE